jgi:hypothetical protein
MCLKPRDLERGAVYRRAWLLEQGMHLRDLSSDAMTRVLPACFTRTDHPADLRRVAIAAQEMLGCPSSVGGATAAELFGVRLPFRATRAGGAAVHLNVEQGSAPRRTRLLVIHRRTRSATVRLHGVTMVDPLVALQEIANRLSHDELVVAVDSLVADRFGTVWRIPLEEVRRRADHARGRGAARLRAAVAEARERVWSPRETHMHLLLRRHGRPSPAMNHPITDPATGIVYYVDLAYPRLRIAIEYDGQDHLTDADRVKADHGKSAALHAEGWTVIRAYAADLHEPTDLLARLDHALATSASPGSTRLPNPTPLMAAAAEGHGTFGPSPGPDR